MLRILYPLSILVFFVFIFTGCDTDVQKKPEPVVASEPKPAPTPQPTSPAPEPAQQQASAAPAEPAQPAVVRSPGSAIPGAVVTNSSGERHEVADVGVGKKGHYGRLSIFDYSIGSYFRMQERISFDLIKHDMQLYEAMNGSAPKTHEEFMEKIINANRSIKLPELKDGCRYEYNPDTKELEVVYPIEN